MPEGVEIRIFCEELKKYFLGATLESIPRAKLHYEGLSKFRAALPAKLTKVGRVGKYSYLIFKDKRGAEWTMHVSLSLTGAWLMTPNKYNKIEFHFARPTRTLYLLDVRHFAKLRFEEGTAGVAAKIAKLGPDMFSRSWTAAEFKHALGEVNAAMPITEALLSQRVVAGIGTYILSETLYCAKVHPAARVGRLTGTEITRIHKCVKEVAARAYRAQTWDIKTLDREVGQLHQFTPAIYGWADDPHGRPTKKYNFKGRGVYYVPAVQKL